MRTILKHSLNFIADAWAQAAGFHFPKKYGWREKIAMLGGSYERETGSLLRGIARPGMTVVDIGAHIGYFTRLLSKAVGPEGRVFAFEPEPENFSLLSLNTKDRPNVRCISAAVSEGGGSAVLHVVAGSTGCHSLIGEGGTPLTVSTVSLDEFLARERAGAVGVIKMDIEGAEPLALKGMRGLISRGQVALVMEFNPAALRSGGTAPEELLAVLEEQGLTVCAIGPHGLTPVSSQDKRWADALQGKDSVNIYAAKE